MKITNMMMYTVAVVAVLGFTSCIRGPKEGADQSKLLRIETSGSQDLSAEAGSPEALCSYLKSQGYFPRNTFSAGTPVAFATSYGTDSQSSSGAEAGQAHGVVGSDGLFEQKDNVTMQVLLCPGSFGGLRGGKCNWKLSGDDGYAELAFRVVCNRAANYGSAGRLHPGYDSMKVSKVGIKASTAGKSFSHADTVEVALSGSSSKAHIYFAKGSGLVATEFREKSQPDGTAKVYFGASDSTQ